MIETGLAYVEKEHEANVFLDLTPKQIQLHEKVNSGNYRRLLYGGAVGGAKTIGLLSVAYMFCRIYEGIRIAVIRKDLPVIKRNTLPSFWKFCPKPFFSRNRYNKAEHIAKAANGSEILFIPESFKDDPEGEKFDGLEINIAILEEANELQQSTYFKIIDRVGRWSLPIMPPPLILFSCNPHQGYLKEMFYNPFINGTLDPSYAFIQSLPKDNPHLTEDYINSLTELKRIAPHLYKKRVEGSWDAEDDTQQLIPWEDIYGSEKKIEFEKIKDKKTGKDVYAHGLFRALGGDIGRYGKDPSVWYVLEGNLVEGFNRIYRTSKPKTSGPEVEHVTKELIIKFEIPHHRCWLDAVGLGGPCIDHLIKDGYDVQSFVGGAKAVEQYVYGKFIFKDLNSQASWNIKTLMEERRLGNVKNKKLQAELSIYWYDIKGEKMVHVRGKEDIKKKLKRSSDDADSFKYAVWGLIYDTVEPQPGFA